MIQVTPKKFYLLIAQGKLKLNVRYDEVKRMLETRNGKTDIWAKFGDRIVINFDGECIHFTERELALALTEYHYRNTYGR